MMSVQIEARSANPPRPVTMFLTTVLAVTLLASTLATTPSLAQTTERPAASQNGEGPGEMEGRSGADVSEPPADSEGGEGEGEQAEGRHWRGWACYASSRTGSWGWGASSSLSRAKSRALWECSVRTPRGYWCYITRCR